jgi:hypothetical protein
MTQGLLGSRSKWDLNGTYANTYKSLIDDISQVSDTSSSCEPLAFILVSSWSNETCKNTEDTLNFRNMTKSN